MDKGSKTGKDRSPDSKQIGISSINPSTGTKRENRSCQTLGEKDAGEDS
jgi:hypothetical protein